MAFPLQALETLTDIVSTPPPGIEWMPYLSGYRYEKWYVLTRTYPDITASRSGMVRTYALIFPLNEVIIYSDIDYLISLLPTELTENQLYINTNCDISKDRQLSGNINMPAGYEELASCLLQSDITLPVIWRGQIGFDNAISYLWNRLWPNARAELRFRLSFTPVDVETAALTIVATPSLSVTRWGSPYRVIDPSSAKIVKRSKAVAYLCADESAQILHDFIERTKASLNSIQDLNIIELCCNSFERGVKSLNLFQLLGTVRYLAHLSPNPTVGSDIKTEILECIEHLSVDIGAEYITALRGVNSSAFENGKAIFRRIIKNWVRLSINALSKDNSQKEAQLVSDVYTDKSEWGELVRDAYNRVLSALDTNISVAIWRWWICIPNLVQALSNAIPNDKSTEAVLVASCPPTLPEKTGIEVRSFAFSREWLDLHAVCLSAYLPFDIALSQHLYVDTDLQHVASLRLLMGKGALNQTIGFVLNNPDRRLVNITGELAVSQYEILSLTNLVTSVWRDIWSACISSGGDPLRHVPDSRKVAHSCLDLLIEGVTLDPKLVQYVTKSPVCDLINYERRTLLWTYLHEPLCSEVLNIAGIAYLDTLKTGNKTLLNQILETQLQEEIVQIIRKNPFQTWSGISVSASIELFRVWPNLTEKDFIEWIDVLCRRNSLITMIEANTIGDFIANKHIAVAAKHIFGLQSNMENWSMCIDKCKFLLPLHDRIKLMLSFHGHRSIIANDWWNCLSEVIVQLYPKGPTDREIWKSSGGDPSLICYSDDGRTQWMAALELLRNGGGGGVTRRGLLHQIRKDFPNNIDIQNLEDLEQFLC
jgi:hypothetical protein